MGGWSTKVILNTGLILAIFIINFSFIQKISAANPPPQSSSVGLEATIPSSPPTVSPTITVPSNGSVISAIPITVSGICLSNLLVKVFDNNIFVGSVLCTNGSYSLKIELFSGQNDLIARLYDTLDQAGPNSNIVTVTFNDAQFLQFGTFITLTSNYAEKGATPGTILSWPITLSGGVGPYAISIDWGDGTPHDLISQTIAGAFNLNHTYKQAGIYTIVIKVTDKNGSTAFLQVVGQGTGLISSKNSERSNIIIQKQIIWWPVLLMFPLIIAAFFVGSKYKFRNMKQRIDDGEKQI